MELPVAWSMMATMWLLLLFVIPVSRGDNYSLPSPVLGTPKNYLGSTDKVISLEPVAQKALVVSSTASNLTSPNQTVPNATNSYDNSRIKYYSESGSVAPDLATVSQKVQEIKKEPLLPAAGSVGEAVQKEPKKKQGKPGLTYDVDDLPRDANGSVIITKEDLAGSGPPFDYVVPIVIAMLAIPFLIVMGTFLYKKSRDFWDRRHYRRMDFLIDGMYNE